MNKLKLLYDVAKTLQDKEEIKGTLQATAEKNQAQIFCFANEFAHNLQTGATKAKISTLVDCDGKKAKHESYTEFDLGSHKHPMFHSFKGHMHSHGHGHGHCHRHHGFKPQGVKAKLNGLMTIINILNQIKITEQNDKSLLLSFDTADMPEEMQQVFREHMERHHRHDGQSGEQPRFMQELGHITTTSLEFSARINQKHEIEKVEIMVKAKCEDAPEKTNLSGKAELNLVW